MQILIRRVLLLFVLAGFFVGPAEAKQPKLVLQITVDQLRRAVVHGSPWRYDTFVPIIFAGAGLEPKDVYRPVNTVDVAATLAAWLGTKPPSGAVGIPLGEVLNQR